MFRSWRDESIFWASLRILFGVAWIYLGVTKMLDINGFIDKVSHYDILKYPLDAAVGHMVIWMHLIVGVSLVTRLAYQGGLWVLLGMLLVFTGALIWAWAMNLEISCGCTPWSAAEKTNYPVAVARNVGLIVFTLILYIAELKRPRHRFRGNKLKLGT